MIQQAQGYLSDLFSLFYPEICLACSGRLVTGDGIICYKCESALPQTDHWHTADNRLMKRFSGRVNVEGAAAFFAFKKGSEVQHLIHQLKYKGREDVGEYIGLLYAQKIKQSSSIIQHIDLIIPVPLHWKKLKLRGYNQCDSFAKGLSKGLTIPWTADALVRNHENISQTKKKKLDRWNNVAEIFSVKDVALFKNKHILLVDDVVTTGATAETCLQTVLNVENTKVSFVSMAIATH